MSLDREIDTIVTKDGVQPEGVLASLIWKRIKICVPPTKLKELLQSKDFDLVSALSHQIHEARR